MALFRPSRSLYKVKTGLCKIPPDGEFCGILQKKSCRWRCFDLLAHYTIFLPEFIKFRRTRGFAEFYKFFSRTDTSVIIYPKISNLSILATLFPNSGFFAARPCIVAWREASFAFYKNSLFKTLKEQFCNDLSYTANTIKPLKKTKHILQNTQILRKPRGKVLITLSHS